MFKIILQVALRELSGAFTRSLLTMLGVIIGVAAVVAMVALGQGAKYSIGKNIENLGANLLIVRPGLMSKRHVRTATAQTLTLDDAKLIRRQVAGVISVAPTAVGSGQVKRYNLNTRTNIIGVTADYPRTRKTRMDRGAFFTMRDVAGARRVAALGKVVADKLFGARNPLGDYIKINGVNFKVVAVMEEKGQAGWWDADDQILIPITTHQKRLFGGSSVGNIFVEAQNQEAMADAEAAIVSLLRRTHKIHKGEDDDFHVRSQVEMIKSMEEMTRTFTFLLGGIAAISLVVGGIGIMNIMLVTVTERTREIGLKKALGARRADILLQFLVESTILAGIGGIIGVGLGAAVAHVVGRFSEWGTHITLDSVVIAYSTALVVGAFFGWWPAYKASRLNPVDALRGE
ncbi:MAG: ABC transporter permease [Nitrospinota bacterium]|nr:ABC transporter permease [Nitrospinota bacterium]